MACPERDQHAPYLHRAEVPSQRDRDDGEVLRHRDPRRAPTARRGHSAKIAAAQGCNPRFVVQIDTFQNIANTRALLGTVRIKTILYMKCATKCNSAMGTATRPMRCILHRRHNNKYLINIWNPNSVITADLVGAETRQRHSEGNERQRAQNTDDSELVI